MPKPMLIRWCSLAFFLANASASADGAQVVNETVSEVKAVVRPEVLRNFDEEVFRQEMARASNLDASRVQIEGSAYFVELTYELSSPSVNETELEASIAKLVNVADDKVGVNMTGSMALAIIEAASRNDAETKKIAVLDFVNVSQSLNVDFGRTENVVSVAVDPVIKIKVAMKITTESGLTKEAIETSMTAVALAIRGNVTMEGDIEEEVVPKTPDPNLSGILIAGNAPEHRQPAVCVALLIVALGAPMRVV